MHPPRAHAVTMIVPFGPCLYTLEEEERGADPCPLAIVPCKSFVLRPVAYGVAPPQSKNRNRNALTNGLSLYGAANLRPLPGVG